MLIRWVLSMDLNEASDEHERIFMGNEFHKRGADTEKALGILGVHKSYSNFTNLINQIIIVYSLSCNSYYGSILTQQ